MYTISRHEAEISVEDYLRDYVDIPTFEKACAACPNYNKTWSCPPYDFDVESYWKQFKTLKLYAHKLILDPEYHERRYTPEEVKQLLEELLSQGKDNLADYVFSKEKEFPGSVCLSSGGSCSKCKGNCAKLEGKPCRFPDTLRHSLESLGGNVGLTVEKLMGLKLEWMEDGRLPSHFVLVSGILIP